MFSFLSIMSKRNIFSLNTETTMAHFGLNKPVQPVFCWVSGWLLFDLHPLCFQREHRHFQSSTLYFFTHMLNINKYYFGMFLTINTQNCGHQSFIVGFTEASIFCYERWRFAGEMCSLNLEPHFILTAFRAESLLKYPELWRMVSSVGIVKCTRRSALRASRRWCDGAEPP